MAHSFTKIKTHSTHLSDEFWYLEAQTRISDLVDPEDMSPSTLEWIYKDARRTYPILPENPEYTYRANWRHYSDQWTSWAEVFGTWVAKIHIERVAMSVAQALIQTNMLDTIPKYTTFVKSHPELNLPSRPHQTYRLTKYGSSWEGGEFADFLKAAIAKVPESVYPDCA